MATITVETGTGSSSSNSYVSEADFATYAADRGVTVSGTAAVLLIQAMDYIEQQPFQGVKGTNAQALQWPRYGVYINDYYVDSDSIPQLLIDAQCEIALGVDGGVNPLANVSRSTKSEKVGDIAVEYMDGARDSIYLAAAESKLSKLLKAGSSGINARVIRA